MIRNLATLLLLGTLRGSVAPDIVIDDFESTIGWKKTPSDGVSLDLSEDRGAHGKSMRIDFDFHGHGGYAVIHKDLNITVPANYEFSFSIRGEAPVNTLEFKLIDPSGDNVWWSNQAGFVFPSEWRHVVRKKRHISFAWGPLGGGDLKRVAAIEFAITAGTGGKGSVWLDDLKLTPLDPDAPYTLTPEAHASSSLSGHGAGFAIDNSAGTSWKTTPSTSAAPQVLDIDFLKRREFGGLVIDWAKRGRPTSYTLSTSQDGSSYSQVYSSGPSAASRDYLYLPESDARYVRLSLVPAENRVANPPYSSELKGITVKPLSWSASMSAFLTAVARDAEPGNYPRYFTNKQSYWAVVGVSGDSREGLIDTRGMLETGKAQFSIEPFLRTGGKLKSWADVATTQSDANGDLPIPSVKWSASPVDLTITAYASGVPESSILFGRYRVANSTSATQKATLYLALRPFQVNPPWQFLNTPGGFARIDSISMSEAVVRINSSRFVLPVSRPATFGAMSFTQGGLVDLLRSGTLPSATTVEDRLGLASGVLSYDITLAPHADSSIYVAVPLHDALPMCLVAKPSQCTPEWARQQLATATSSWATDLGKVRIQLPKSASRITESIRSNLAYILINRDGPAIQPGSRSYERSWIRDGSLTSAAMLRLGHEKEVRKFLEWYATFQFDNGKIPCCVDARGSDPVPENDSHGEFIYLVAEYFRHTGDTATLNRMWPHVAKAVTFMDSLRQSRKTPEFQSGEKRVFYGLLPQSISHEGYSAKPMHSYWDDFFALRGFKDAVEIAIILHKPELKRYTQSRDVFTRDLHASIALAMKNHKIAYIPGAAELGDFDATSTTVGVNPGGELGGPLDSAFRRTFDRYYADFVKRRDGPKRWEIYTPYEWRVAGTFVRLGQKKRAHELADFFFQHQRPKEWHQWAEVVMQKVDSAQFIGDMPHTWVGSDFIRSALDMFAYERETDSSLVISAGIPARWVREDDGIRIENLSTHYGRLSYSMKATGKNLDVLIGGGIHIPAGGVVVMPPIEGKPQKVMLNGTAIQADREIRLKSLPATLTITY